MFASVWCDVIVAEQLAIERQKLFEAIGYSEGGPKEEYPREVSLSLWQIHPHISTNTDNTLSIS